MKAMNAARKFGQKFGQKVAAGAALTMGTIGVALAEVPPEATAKMTTAGTDSNTLGYAALVVIIGIVSIKWMRRAV